MDMDRFAEGYREPPSHQRYREEDPELRAFLQGPRKQASLFDRFATLYLKGTLDDAPESILRTLVAYEDEWLTPHFPAVERQARSLNRQAMDFNAVAANEIGFHALNREMLPLWESLLLPPELKPQIGADEYHVMQTRLAMTGAHLSRELHQTRAQAERRSSLRGLSRTLVGRLNEIDTAITLLEFVKFEAFTSNHSSLILIPAPPRFEAGYKNKIRNADFLLIDTEFRQARGIQVKSRLDENAARFDPTTGTATIDGYDSSFVTIIDCSADLGNNTTRDRWVKSQPGNIALEYLNERVSVRQSSLHPTLKSRVGDIMQAKGIARELAQAEPRAPELNNSVQRIAPRLIHDLYK